MIGRNAAHIDITATDKTARAMSSAKRNLTGLGRSARGILSGLGVGLGASAFIRLSKDAIEYGSSLTDAAAATRVGVEEYQVLAYAAQDAGASMDKVTTALARIQKATNDASNGLSTYTRAFDALGINVDEFRQLSPDRQFEVLGRAMVSSSDQARAYASVLDIIGSRNAPRLMEVLQRLGTDGFDEIERAAREAGQVMNEFTAQQLDAAADSLERFNTRVKVASGTIVKFWMDLFEGENPVEEQVQASANALRNNFSPALNAASDAWTRYQQALDVSGPNSEWVQYLKELADAALENAAAAEKAARAQEDLSAAAGADASDTQMERIGRLTRELSEMRASPEENIKILRAEVQGLQADLRRMTDENLAGTEEWAKTYISALEKAKKLHRLEETAARESERERESVLSGLGLSGSSSASASAAAPPPTDWDYVSDMYSGGKLYRRTMLERERAAGTLPSQVAAFASGGGTETADAATAFKSDAAKAGQAVQQIAAAMSEFLQRLETAEQQIANAR